MTRKIVEDAWVDDSICALGGTRLPCSRRPPNSWAQKTSSGLLIG
jgi:hypothetical protein